MCSHTCFDLSAVALLNIPGFIERLCKLATRKVTEAAGASARLELEDWHSWLDNALVLDALMQLAIEEAEQSSTGEILFSFLLCYFLLLWFFSILSLLVGYLVSPTLIGCLSESSDESSLSSSPLRHRLPQSMKIVHEIMYKVEVLYVLCVLLMGRQRNQVL